MTNSPAIAQYQAVLEEARKQLIEAATALPIVSAERLLSLRESAYKAWVALEEAKRGARSRR